VAGPAPPRFPLEGRRASWRSSWPLAWSPPWRSSGGTASPCGSWQPLRRRDSSTSTSSVGGWRCEADSGNPLRAPGEYATRSESLCLAHLDVGDTGPWLSRDLVVPTWPPTAAANRSCWSRPRGCRPTKVFPTSRTRAHRWPSRAPARRMDSGERRRPLRGSGGDEHPAAVDPGQRRPALLHECGDLFAQPRGHPRTSHFNPASDVRVATAWSPKEQKGLGNGTVGSVVE
jgi:hypothetical protein